MTRRVKLIIVLAVVAAAFARVQTQPQADIKSNNARVRLLSDSDPPRVLVRACANCHSNVTRWPWYSHIVPFSWWLAKHVHEGREKLDFSRWESYSLPQKRDKLESICGVTLMGRMPPPFYAVMHPEARLSGSDKNGVCAWVEKQIAAEGAHSALDGK